VSDEPAPADLVPVTLVPVEVFGSDCECHDNSRAAGRPCRNGWGYGLMDAVSAWSDCNRAIGRIYRVDDTEPEYRQPGETITVYVPREQLAWLEKSWGDDAEAGDELRHQ
jgi:hypothetical protein